MTLHIASRDILGKAILVIAVALMPIPLFAVGQHHSESKGGGGQHASRPSNAGGQRHTGGGQSHAGPSHAPNRGGQAHAPSGHPGGAVSHEGGNAGRPGNVGGNRGGNVGGNRGANAAGNRGGNAGANRGGNAGGNRGGSFARSSAGGQRLPGRTVSLKGGGTASFRQNGQIRSINRNGMHISNGLHGGRTVMSERGGTRIVSTGHGGYVQRSYMTRGGVSYYSRTYYAGGAYHVGVYRSYYYGGFHYYGYHPGFWFHPGFYGWGWHPWGAPFYWGIGIGGWGWAGAPWWGFYSGWWNPYPYYAGPWFWLTDWLVAQQLQAAYAAQANAAAGYDSGPANYGGGGSANYSDSGGGQPANTQVTLSPEVKDAIAEEVKAQLQEQEQQAPSQGLGSNTGSAPAPTGDQVPPALDPARRTFVVNNAITLVSDGQECELTGGDVLTRLTDTPDAKQKVTASVQASKKGECSEGKQVLVSVDDLQEMHNHFVEQLNNGMKELAAKQGTNGMPKAPDASTVASDLPDPQPDQNASKEISDQQAQADQAEAQAKQDAASAGGGAQ